MNSYDARVAAQLELVNAKEQQLLNLRNTQAAEFARQQSWGNAGQWDTPQYRQATVAYEAATQSIIRVEAELKLLQEELANLRRLQDRENKAAAEAIAAGLTPEAAYLKAQSQVERTELVTTIIKWVAIAAAIVGIGYAITVFIRWRKARK